jgi:hypothetical protein
VVILRWLLVLLGSAGVVAGCLGLLLPIGGDHDRCGHPFSLHMDNAAKTDDVSAQVAPSYGGRSIIYQADCTSAVDAAMAWALPVGITGALVLIAALTIRIGGRETPSA